MKRSVPPRPPEHVGAVDSPRRDRRILGRLIRATVTTIRVAVGPSYVDAPSAGDGEPAHDDAPVRSALAPFIYELLDAQYDTIRLAHDGAFDGEWAAHLDYLRSLQRRGRELLAEATAEAPP